MKLRCDTDKSHIPYITYNAEATYKISLHFHEDFIFNMIKKTKRLHALYWVIPPPVLSKHKNNIVIG